LKTTTERSWTYHSPRISERWGRIVFRAPETNDELIDIVTNRRRYLGIERFDDAVLRAMRETDRGAFAPPGTRDVYEDSPFPIAKHQTCSQPSMVAAMATLLELRPGLKVLEVGTGCGYSAAVTARLISPGGTLFSVEIVPDLTADAERNLAKFGLENAVRLVTGDGSAGMPEQAPFDRIYLTAGVGRHFDEEVLLSQLSPGGILLYPESYGSMFLVKKTPRGNVRNILDGVSFVFLKGKNSGYR